MPTDNENEILADNHDPENMTGINATADDFLEPRNLNQELELSQDRGIGDAPLAVKSNAAVSKFPLLQPSYMYFVSLGGARSLPGSRLVLHFSDDDSTLESVK